MRPTFILSLPRSRTAWLTVYFNGAGVPCFHDAWRHVKTIKGLRKEMEGTKSEYVVNADSSNILFYNEIKEEFPNAKFITILRNPIKVQQSLSKTYGHVSMAVINKLYFDILCAEANYTADYDTWDSEVSHEMFKCATDGNMLLPLRWHLQAHELKVEITRDRIENDIWHSGSGSLDHIVNRLRG